MPGKVIGNEIPRGFVGNVARMSDNVIAPFQYAATNEGNIAFGEAVVFDATNNGVRKYADGDNAESFIGLAVRNIGQPKVDSNDGFYYVPGEVVDVLTRGTLMVVLEDVSGLAARGTVYFNPSTGMLTAASSHTPAGGSAVSHIALTNMKFGNGKADTDKVTEVTVLTRAI